MARRRPAGARAIDPALLIDSCLRLAGAIVLASLALIVWNVGTRSPAGLVRDIRRAAGDPRAIAAGFASFAVGTIFSAAATVMLWPAVSDNLDLLIPVEIFAFVVALGVEYLVGNDARAFATGPRKRGPERGS